MSPPSYMRPVVDRNVVMRRLAVLGRRVTWSWPTLSIDLWCPTCGLPGCIMRPSATFVQYIL